MLMPENKEPFVKKHICGIPEMDDDNVFAVLLGYHHKNFKIGVPTEAVDTCTANPTGCWRIAGDACNPRLDVQMVLAWHHTPVKIKWFAWPPMQRVELEPEVHELVVWVKEHRITFTVPEGMVYCSGDEE